MEHFGFVIRQLRESKGLPLREVSQALEIDQAVVSKLERRQRSATLQQVQKLAAYYQVPLEELLIHWLSDKIAHTLTGQEVAMKALEMARQKIIWQAREDYDRENIFHQVYHFFSKTSVSRAWVYGPFASGKDILCRSLDLLLEPSGGDPLPDARLKTLKLMLEKTVRLKVNLSVKPFREAFPADIKTEELILIWENTK